MSVSSEPRFKKAFPYQQDVLALPVKDLDAALCYYFHEPLEGAA